MATGHSIGSVSVESVTGADGMRRPAPPRQGCGGSEHRCGVDTVPLPPLDGWGSRQSPGVPLTAALSVRREADAVGRGND